MKILLQIYSSEAHNLNANLSEVPSYGLHI